MVKNLKDDPREEMITIDPLRNQVLDWVEGLRIRTDPYGQYRMSTSTEGTIFSSCFAVFVRELLNDLDSITLEERQEWIDFIQSAQDRETGIFIDPSLKSEGKWTPTIGRRHDWGYVTWQLTTFCLSALRTLGAEPIFEMKFLDNWRDPRVVRSFLNSLNWEKGTWAAGNVAMFLGICLMMDSEIRVTNSDIDQEKIKNDKIALEAFFQWHDENQDPRTGFWGTDRGTPYPVGLYGAMHQFLLYYYSNRSLKFSERIIDHSIKVQEKDGHFCPGSGGGGCEDYDVIDTIVSLSKDKSYRWDESESTLNRALAATLNSRGDDGGFLWANRKRFSVADWISQCLMIVKYRNVRTWIWSMKYSYIQQRTLKRGTGRMPIGWVTTPIPQNESDLFSTWFRLLNIAEISQIIETPYSKFNWKFLKAPGLGWHKKLKEEPLGQ